MSFHHVKLAFCIMILQASSYSTDSASSSTIKPVCISNDVCTKAEFEFSIKEEGNYYISCAMYGIPGEKYVVKIDNYRAGYLCPNSTGLQNVFFRKAINGLEAETIYLKNGSHSLVIPGNEKYKIPNVLEIRIGKNYEETGLSFPNPSAKSSKSPDVEQQSSLLNNKVGSMATVSNSALVSNQGYPFYEYTAAQDRPFSYTYNQDFSFSASQSVTLSTDQVGGQYPTIYLFNKDNPANGTWMNDNPNHNIAVTITVAGIYRCLVTGYYSDGYCENLYLNNVSVAQNFWVAGGAWLINPSKPDYPGSNFFTCNTTPGGDPVMYVLSTSNPHGIIAWNDDHSPSDNFWGLNSHCRWADAPSAPVANVLVFAYSIRSTGTTDIYGYVKNDDAGRSNWMLSSVPRNRPGEQTYNCFAWSGGISSEITDPVAMFVYSNGTTADVQAFDNYYGNKLTNGSSYPRYPGAPTYVRCDINDEQAVIDLWGALDYSKPGSYYFTHASVKKSANYQLHGYGWESKLNSSGSRYFHPRITPFLQGYGSILYSYKPSTASSSVLSNSTATHSPNTTSKELTAVEFASTQKMKAMGINHPLSFDSSVALGLTVNRNAHFTESEKRKIDKLVSIVPAKIRNDFFSIYSAWENNSKNQDLANYGKINDISKSEEYTALKVFCIKNGENIWPLLFKMAYAVNPYKQLILKDALLNSELAKSKMRDVEAELLGDQYTRDGEFIFTSEDDRYTLLCKKLLSRL